jgi:hypothetical protein
MNIKANEACRMAKNDFEHFYAYTPVDGFKILGEERIFLFATTPRVA